MNLKWWFYLTCILLVIGQGCKKEAGNMVNPKTDTIPITPPVVIPILIPFAVNNVLQSNMVIQRDKPFFVWGKATVGNKISVKVSWIVNNYVTTPDQNGDWSVAIPASPANVIPQNIICRADSLNPIVLSNILIGDVWLCSGQSNMVMPVDSLAPFNGVTNFASEMVAANYPLIRVKTVPQDLEPSPLNAFGSSSNWVACSPGTVGNFSGVAYYFAQKLFNSLNIPIGIIVSAINGSGCSDWSEGGFEFNGMINPLTQLSIKGFLWYQGENDSHISPAGSYTTLNNVLISQWRGDFKQGALPFYYVQMTPFAEDYFSTTPPGGDLTSDYYAKFREAQANVRTIANTGMAVTMDVGEAENHHPRNKKPVGERLALLALKNTYNVNVACTGPQFLSWSQTGNSVIISYANSTANGLNTIDNKPLKQYFFVAGADHLFYTAFAVIRGNTIVLTTNITVQAIRYAFTNAPVTNLQNAEGLPAEPFRTDNWDN